MPCSGKSVWVRTSVISRQRSVRKLKQMTESPSLMVARGLAVFSKDHGGLDKLVGKAGLVRLFNSGQGVCRHCTGAVDKGVVGQADPFPSVCHDPWHNSGR